MAQFDETVPGVVVINDSNGHTVVERDSDLKRLHYFDGKFLRAPDMQLEQTALLNQVHLSNQAGGSGIVHGFSCLLNGNNTLQLSAGLAIDSQGRLLTLGNDVDLSIAGLIARASNNAADDEDCQCKDSKFGDCEKGADSGQADSVLENESLYLITLHYVEAYCGEEDVYGKLCESACVTSTQRPYILPGIEIRAVPLSLDDLKQSLLISNKHLRSRVASAYFEMERKQGLSHISKEGLASNVWCLGAEAAGGNGVPVAVVGRAGSNTLFLDSWTARRERMESPPRNYWAGRMAMRPWQVFLAQVLQFQCQLTHCIGKIIDGGEIDPCAEERKVAAEAAEQLKQLMRHYERIAKGIENKAPQAMEMMPQLSMVGVRATYDRLIDVMVPSIKLPTRWLIDCGIVELPSGGYLPVDNLGSVSVNDQVQRMMGEGVDLRFCAVRPDYIPHALEEAQHMERICLLKGLENPDAKPKVDVLVPDGLIETYEPKVAGTAYEMEIYGPNDKAVANLPMKLNLREARVMYGDNNYRKFNDEAAAPMYIKQVLSAQAQEKEEPLQQNGLQGAARGEELDSGGYAFYFAGRMPPLVRGLVQLSAQIMQVAELKAHRSMDMSRARMAEYLKKMEMYYESPQPVAAAMPMEEVEVEVAASEEREEVYDMWLNLRSDRDLFSLSRGERSNVSLEATVMIELEAGDKQFTMIMELTQQGDLVIDDVLEAPPAANLRGTLSSNGMLNTILVINGERKETPTSMRINEQVYLKRAPGSQLGFTLSIPELSFFNQWDNDWLDLDVGLSFERDWVSATEASFKLVASYSVEVEGKDQQHGHDADVNKDGYVRGVQYQQMQSFSQRREMTLVSGRQVINPDVLKADHILHDTSLTALNEIGQALQQNAYADSRARLLFPPPKPVPTQLRVFAKHDWVMFHRRRDKQCGYEPVVDVSAKPRQYRLLLVDSLKSKKQLAAYVDALANNQGHIISQVGYKDAGKVEFEAGLQTVLSSHSGLRSDWDRLIEGDQATLMFGAIASRGAAYDEGPALARLRLQRLSSVLDSVTPVDEEAKFINLNQVPDVLAEGESDGVIVMVVPSLAILCHNVYRVQWEPDTWKKQQIKLEEKLKGAKDGEMEHLAKMFKLEKLNSKALFHESKGDVTKKSGSELLDNWKKMGGGVPEYALIIAPFEDGSVEDNHLYQAQLSSITRALGGQPSQMAQSFVPNDNKISDCAAVSIMVTFPSHVESYSHDVMKAYIATVEDSVNPVENVEVLEKALSFDEEHNVIMNDGYNAVIATLKESSELIKVIDVVNDDEVNAKAAKAKAELLLARLKEEGVAEATAKVKMRQPTKEEKAEIFDIGKRLMGGFIFKQ